jgi:hypothetical protein
MQSFWSFPDFSEFFFISVEFSCFFSQFSDFPKSSSQVKEFRRQSDNQGPTASLERWFWDFWPFFNGKFLDQNREISMKSP